MIERFLALGRQTIVYGLGGAAIQLVGLLTTPIFTRVFHSSQYGVLETTIAAYAALLVLADLGLTSSAQRSYFDYDADHEPQRRAALSTGLSMSLALALLWAGVALAFAGAISTWQFKTPHYANLVRIAAISVPVTILANFLRETVRLKFKAWAYTAAVTAGAAGGTTFAVVDVLGFHGGIASLLYGTLVGNAIMAVVAFAAIRTELLGRFSFTELGRMFRYGLPLIPTSIALWGVGLVDRSLLIKLGGAPLKGMAAVHKAQDVTGQYAVANRYGSLMMFAITAFTLAYGPFQLGLWQEDTELEKRVRARMLTYLTVALVGLAVLLSLFAREMTTLVAPSYTRAYQAVGVLTMSVAVFGISNLVLFGIGITRRTGYIEIYTGLALVFNVVLNLLLIPPWGMMGAAVATLVAYAVLAVFYYHRSQILYHTQYEPRKTVTTVVLGGCAMVVGVIRFDSIGVSLAVKLATALVFVASLWVFGVLDRDDLGGVRALFGRLRSREAVPVGPG
jgi:O-antigen/teichoic acid export membrane protein